MSETKGKYIYDLYIDTGWVGGDHHMELDVTDQFSKDEWDDMTDFEREKYLQDELEYFVQERIETYWMAQ